MPAEAPAAPPPPVAPVTPESPPPNAAMGKGELHITESAVDRGPAPEPPRKGSARERMYQELRRKAGQEEPTTPAPAAEAAHTPEGEEKPAANTATSPSPPTEPEKKGKINPWKLVDEHKAARIKAEQEIVELRKQMPDPSKLQEIEKEKERIASIEKRAKELEEEIRFVNYSKSKEFEEKYQQPYQEAWKRWMGELQELTVEDASSGQERPISANDLLQLVNLPLQKAREAANAMFGDYANDVMNARKEIRGLFDAQNKALDEARKLGTERDEQRSKQMREAREQAFKQIKASWEKYNNEMVSDEKYGLYFKPVEGDTEGNQYLAQGYEMADRAFNVSPLNPKLTDAEREDIIRLHTAVRNRSAAFGRLTHMNKQLMVKLKAVTEELNKFKGAQPTSGEGVREKPGTGPHTAKDDVYSALRKLAH